MKIAIVIDKPRANYLPDEEGEQEDQQSIRTMRYIKEALSDEYEVTHMVMDCDIIDRLKKAKVDLVFNLCNGIKGEASLSQLPSMLEFADIPYTGSGPLGHGIAFNKIFAGEIFKASNIKTPDFIYLSDAEEVDNIKVNYPVILKPKDEGSSRGIHDDSLIFDKETLKEKLEEELKIYNPPMMIMEYIEGREFTVGVIGDREDVQVLPLLEIDLSELPEELNKIYSFEAKVEYADDVKYIIPARVDKKTKEKIEEAAIAAFKCLGLRDYARVDIRLKDGIPYVIEVNSLPGLDKNHSDICKMAESIDMKYEELIKKIVKHAIRRIKSPILYRAK